MRISKYKVFTLSPLEIFVGFFFLRQSEQVFLSHCVQTFTSSLDSCIVFSISPQNIYSCCPKRLVKIHIITKSLKRFDIITKWIQGQDVSHDYDRGNRCGPQFLVMRLKSGTSNWKTPRATIVEVKDFRLHLKASTL